LYRDPKSLIAAKTFSDPPLNTVEVEKNGEGIFLEDGVHWKTSKYTNIPNGNYTLGFRAHHLKLSSTKNDDLKLAGEVLVTELSGSESFVHLKVNVNNWVVHTHGIYNFLEEEQIGMFLSLSNCYLFDTEGERVYAK